MSQFKDQEAKLNNEIIDFVGKLYLTLPLNLVIDKAKEWISQKGDSLLKGIDVKVKEYLAEKRGVTVEEVPIKNEFDSEYYDLSMSYQICIGKVYSRYTNLEDEYWPPLIEAMYRKSIFNKRMHLLAFRLNLIQTNRFYI